MADAKTVAELEAQVTTLTKQLEDLQKGDDGNEELEKLQTQLEELTEKMEAQAAELELEKAKAKMSDDEKEFADSLEDDEKKKKFISASKADRQSQISKSREGDETFEFDGRTISKRAVGETQFDVMKSMAKRIDEDAKKVAKAQDERDAATFTKRAEDELPHFPGEVIAKASVLKAVSKLSKDEQETLTTMLKAGEEALAKGFTSMGSKGDKGRPDRNAFITKVAEIQKSQGVTKTVAMQKARDLHPEEFKAYQAETN